MALRPSRNVAGVANLQATLRRSICFCLIFLSQYTLSQQSDQFYSREARANQTTGFDFINSAGDTIMRIQNDRMVRIGAANPNLPTLLGVKSTRLHAGHFVSDSLTANSQTLRAEFTASGQFNAAAIFGMCRPAPYYGYGGRFEGGFIGADGMALAAGIGERYGVRGTGSNGVANYGVFGSALNGTFSYGVFGTAGGAATNYAVYASGDLVYTGNLIALSDQKFKENLRPVEGALATIRQLRPYQFTFIDHPRFTHLHLPGGRHYGFLAQDVQTVLPELVKEAVHPSAEVLQGEQATGEPTRYLGYNPTELIPLLVKALQEQQELIEQQQQAIKALEARIAELSGR